MKRRVMDACLFVALFWVLSLFSSTAIAASKVLPQPTDNQTQSEAVESPEEIRETVRRYLTSNGIGEEAKAVQRLGARTIPYMIEAAAAYQGRNFHASMLMGRALAKLSLEDRQDAARRFGELLADQDCSEEFARGVLAVIEDLKEGALVIEPRLIELRQARPELTYLINEILVGAGSTESGIILAEMLRKAPSIYLLHRIAYLGTAAGDAGPTVLGMLDHPDWDVRLAAVRTLGLIGYAEATPTLIDLLDDPADVRLHWVAAKALARLGAQPAKSKLEHMASSHWHPVVRRMAKSALDHIASGQPYPPEEARRHWSPYSLSMAPTDIGVPDLVQEPRESKLYKVSSPDEIKKLSYDRVICSYRYDPNGMQGDVVPDVALRVDNGWLAGSCRGEWGGELVFVGDDGRRTYLVGENTRDLFKLGQRHIALAGLSHLSGNRGMVYVLEQGSGGQWYAKRWRALPGAPESAGKLDSGEILISTVGAGNIILRKDGTFRMGPY